MNATKHRSQERKNGMQWARDLSAWQRSAFIDSQGRGGFDWRDYFNVKPSSLFIDAAFCEALRIERSAAA